MLKSLAVAALDLVFPPLCHACHAFIPHAGTLHICTECHERLLPIVSPFCSACGVPFSGAGGDHICSRCATSPPSFDAARGAYAHEGVISDLIHAFKYRNKTHLRRPLAQLTLAAFPDLLTHPRYDLMLPVPLHRKKLASRGFNQAVLLGEIIARQACLPFDRHNLRRTRWTEPQINLSAEERRVNVRGAFAVSDPAKVAGQRILLVDDVLTTGSTVEECAKVLKKFGAVGVDVLTVARAMK